MRQIKANLRQAGPDRPIKKSTKRISRWSIAAWSSVLAVLFAATALEAQAIEKKHFRKPVSSVAKNIKVDVNADQIVIDSKTNIATATGTVEITYGPYKLKATKVVYNIKTKVMDATGEVYFRERNGNFSYGDHLRFDTKFRDVFAEHVKAMLTNDTIVQAQYARRKEGPDGTITVYTKSRYTACVGCKSRNGEPLWEVVSDESIHDEKAKTLAHKNPRLKIAGVTVAGLPYLKLPAPGVKRMTGFLQPDFRYTDYAGFGLITPYYWNLAPNYDLTFSPYTTLRQGPAADLEWRHRLSNGQYNIRGYGVYQLNPQSSLYDTTRWRGAVDTHGKFNLNQDWDWGWDGLVSTDRRFLRRYGFDSTVIAKNDVYVTGLWDQTYVDAEAFNFGSLSADVSPDKLPYAMPYFQAEHTFKNDVFGGDLSWSVNAYSLARNQSDTPFDTVHHGKNQSHLNAELAWKNELISDFGSVLTTSAKMRSDVYTTDSVPDPTAASGLAETSVVARARPSVGMDLRMPLIGSNEIGQLILSPVFQVFAATNEKRDPALGNEDAISLNLDHNSIFLEDRFTGFDRYEGGVRANAGLNFNIFANNGAFARASIGESFHLAGENSFGYRSGLQNTKSDIVGAITVSPWDGISFSYEGRAEQNFSAINRQEASVGLSFDRFSGDASYLFIDKEPAFGRKYTEEFVAADARYQLSPGWYVTSGLKYDLQENFFRQRAIGLEFDCECMKAGISYSATMASASAQTDHRVMFSFNLATLGGSSAAARF